MTITIIIFDLGGVFLNNIFRALFKDLIEQKGANLDTLRAAFGPLFHRWKLGFIDEDEFYHGEIQNIKIGDPVIKESNGPIYVLRQINIHRTIPQPPARKELESPLTEDFDKKESEKKTPD